MNKAKTMHVLYCRTSTIEQNTDRQRINEKQYSFVVEDKCSGAIPFFDREGGKKIKQLIDRDAIKHLSVITIDRLGRDCRDIINTIHFFTERGICIHFISQGLRTIDDNGKENPISNMVISILSVISEMERKQIKERQLEGIAIAKSKNKYLGRKTGTIEDVLKFLSKPKNKKALHYLKKGYSNSEAAKLASIHINTVTKIRKLGLTQVA